MKRKIFISINIPDKIKKRLIQTIQKWQDLPPHQDCGHKSNIKQDGKSWCEGLPVKWTREANLHVTLLFLGHVDEETVPEICEKVRQTCENEDIFDIEFDKIELFPSDDDPKTVALTGPASPELLKLYENLEKELGLFTANKKSFRPHITLGRGRKYKWESLENKPSISENFSLVLPVETTDVMASDFSDGGQEYVVIESCPLR